MNIGEQTDKNPVRSNASLLSRERQWGKWITEIIIASSLTSKQINQTFNGTNKILQKNVT